MIPNKSLILLCLTIMSYINCMSQAQSLYFKSSSGNDIKVTLYEVNGESRLTVDQPFLITKLVQAHMGQYAYSPWKVNFDLFNGTTISYTEPKVYVDVDYNWVFFNDETYDIPISAAEYESRHKTVNTPYYNGGSANSYSTSPTQSGSGSSTTSSLCKYCHGSGNCSSCHGKGYKYNPYSGSNDTCPSCSGSGRCFNCYGSGRQR